MGCQATKQADVRFDDIDRTEKVEEAPQCAPASVGKPSRRSSRPCSDVGEKSGVAITAQLVNRNSSSVHEQYTVNALAVLGRGGCGSVCIAEHKATGKKYAMCSSELSSPPTPALLVGLHAWCCGFVS